jgi:hypothetical protein
MKNNLSIKIYIFYHNKAKLPEEVKELNDDKFQLINLDNITLPEDLIVPLFSETENRALFAEYLGILYIKPETDLVGCFTYSIPLKFSAKWALETGNHNLFMPGIKFQDLKDMFFDPRKIYAPEFKNPCHIVKNEIEDIHQKFPAGTSIKDGPFKGSFIVDRNYFLQFQEWFKRITQYIIKKYDPKKRATTESPFGMSEISCRDEEQKEMDKLRNAWGYILERAVAYYFGSKFKEHDKIRLGHHIINHKINTDNLLYEVQKSATDNIVIVVFGDKKYEQVINTWCRYADSIGIENYIVIAQDKTLYQKLCAENINCALNEYEGDLKDFWTFRLKIIKSILDVNISVIHSDADAFWLKNPLKDYFSNPDYDILSSQGTIQPPDVLKKLGFVLCCGFIYFKSSPNTLHFFEHLLSESARLRSDQIALNRLIANSDIEWENIKPDYTLEYNDKKFDCYKRILTGRSDKLTIGLLPHKKFQRLYENARPYIAHLLSKKTQESKIDVLTQINQYPSDKHSRSITEKSTSQINAQNRSTNLVWLASYPRSGNTLLRIILNHNFGLKSYSIYNDPNDIGKISEVGKVVGHVNMDWSFLGKHSSQLQPEDFEKFDRLRYHSDQLSFVKTHSPRHEGFTLDRVIYIYRDGRSALRSHASYAVNFSKGSQSEEEILEQLLVCGAELPSTWNNHIISWSNHSQDKILFLKFEDVVSDFQLTFEKISRFLNLPILRNDILTFEQLHAINPHFFRKGKKKSWHDLFDDKRNALFWFLNNEAMTLLGYDQDKSPVCDLLPNFSKLAKFDSLKKTFSKKELSNLDESLSACLDVLSRNIGKIPSRYNNDTVKNIIDAYAHCKTSLDLHDGKKIMTKLEHKWRKLIEHHSFQECKRYWPYVYIATPALNYKKCIDQLINSVISLEGDFFIRYHIQDGNATDDTLKKLQLWDQTINNGNFNCLCKGIVFSYNSCNDKIMFNLVNDALDYISIPNHKFLCWVDYGVRPIIIKKKIDSFPKSKDMRSKQKYRAKSQFHYGNFNQIHIVIHCKNAEHYIDKTINSIISQSGNFIICCHVQDRGSTDGTINKLKSWMKAITSVSNPSMQSQQVKFSWSSESDKSEYEAIIKGFDEMFIKPDEFMTWVNAGDILMSGIIKIVCNIATEIPEVQWLGSAKHVKHDTGKEVRRKINTMPTAVTNEGLCKGNNKYWKHFHHEGVFFKKRLWFRSRHALHDIKLAKDWALWREMAHHAEFYQYKM